MPQPIDPYTELGRVTAAERIQQVADRASLAAQSRTSEGAANQREAAESQVQQAFQKSEEVDRELRRRNPFMGKRKKRKENPEESDAQHTFYSADEHTEVAEDPDEHDLDVTIQGGGHFFGMLSAYTGNVDDEAWNATKGFGKNLNG